MPASGFSRLSLGAKLIVFSTFLTVTAVGAGFLFLSIEIRRRTKALLAETLAQHQRTILSLQQQSLQEVLRTSTLMTDSPTLRAAMETYQTEASVATAARPDLLETIQNEAEKVSAGLGRDLLVVTDRDGKVLASSGSSAGRPAAGDDLFGQPVVRAALDARTPVGPRNFTVLPLHGEHFQAGGAPIVLQGFVIGAVILGDRLDQEFVDRLRQSFDSDFAVLVGSRVVGTTLHDGLPEADDMRTLAALRQAGQETPALTRFGSEEFVAASLPLGMDGAGNRTTLVLLHSLTRALDASNRSLLLLFVTCGSAAIVASAAAAWWMSRSVLRPMDDFVGFMRSVAASADHTRRFRSASTCTEVDTLADAYHHLMDSLQAHEERLLRTAREDLDRLARLKESEKLAALGRMLSGAAHEINNPLAGVVGNLELLLRGDGIDPSLRQRLERIHGEGGRVVALVRSLLRVSHRDTGEKVQVDLNHLLRQAIDLRRHDFAAARIRLEFHHGPEPILVIGRELELEQVFLNLLNNAYDALSDAGAAPTLTIRTAHGAHEATVVVEDNGPGMKEPDKVFEHFYTTKRVGEGTGLGLSISHAIVHDHGGRICADNRPQGGARFTIVLPLAEGLAAAPVKAPAATKPAPPRTARLEVSVLLVDDEPTLVDLQREILESLGATVVGVGSGVEALALLMDRSFDLIVTDLKMPGAVTGREIFRWVATHRPEATRRFVFVTGDAAGSFDREALERAGARFLWKPFALTEYVETLAEACREVQPTD